MFSFRGDKLYIHRDKIYGAPLYIGKIDKSSYTLFIHDTDNYHEASRSLGIDEEILNKPELEYLYISIKYAGKTLQTTRYYFKTHSIVYNLLNGRKQRFMPIRDFDLDKALDYERNLDKLSSEKQMDIFEIGRTEDVTGNRLFDTFIKNLEKTTEKVIKQEKQNGFKEISFK